MNNKSQRKQTLQKKKTLDEIENEYRKNTITIDEFYSNNKSLNWNCAIKGMEERIPVTQIVAEWLVRDLGQSGPNDLEQIGNKPNELGYYASHKGDFPTSTDKRREEERYGIKLFGNNFINAPKESDINAIIDYQTPIVRTVKGDPSAEGIGKIDLLGVNEKNKELYIMPIKKT